MAESNEEIVSNFEDYIKKVKEIKKRDSDLSDFAHKTDKKTLLKLDINKLINDSFSNLKTKDDYTYFFRGQTYTWSTVPGIYRKGYLKKENEVYQYALRNFPHKLDDLSYFNQLATIAHFNAPTRLLDITSNPLVALYFALRKTNSKKKDPTVYVFKIPNKMISPISSDKVMILSALATRTNKEKEELKKSTIKLIEKYKLGEIINSGDSYIKQLNNWAFPKLIHEIQKKCPAFKNSIEPQDLLLPRVVLAPKIEQRIIAQSGAFLVTGIELYKNFNNDIINCFKVAEIKIDINKSETNKTNTNEANVKNGNANNDDFSEYLDLFQIKEETLFPEMESALKALR